MPINLRSILFPRASKSVSSDIFKQLSDSFRLREQNAELEGFGAFRTPEAVGDVIEKNKKELFDNLDKLNTNQVRDLGSVIKNLEVKALGMVASEAVKTDDIKEAMGKEKNLLKKNYISNPYKYVDEMKKLYNIALDGNNDFEGIRKRIEGLSENDLNVSNLEELEENYGKEWKKYDEILTAFNQKRQSKLDTYSLVYTMSGGRVRDMEFIQGPEKKGVITDIKYNYESGKSKLNQEQGIAIRLTDTQMDYLPEEKEIAFGFSPFIYTKGVSSWKESMPARYQFMGDVNTFDFSELEPEGIETRSVGDMLQGSNDKIYYVDKNKDLRPVTSENTYRMLLPKTKGIKHLTPDEEEKLCYLVKEPFDIGEAVRQNRELSGMASQVSGKILSKIRGPISPPSVPLAGFRPTEYKYQKKALLQQAGKEKVIKKTKDIFGGVLDVLR